MVCLKYFCTYTKTEVTEKSEYDSQPRITSARAIIYELFKKIIVGQHFVSVELGIENKVPLL